jgi:hypothetical protein
MGALIIPKNGPAFETGFGHDFSLIPSIDPSLETTDSGNSKNCTAAPLLPMKYFIYLDRIPD